MIRGALLLLALELTVLALVVIVWRATRPAPSNGCRWLTPQAQAVVCGGRW